MNDHLIAMILEAMDYRSSRRTSQDSRNERHKNREMRQCSSKITICQNSTAENQWEEDNKKKPTVNRRRSKKLNLSSELWDFEGTNCKENGPPRGCFVRNVRNSERRKSEKVARVKRRRHSEKKGRDEKSGRREKKKRLSKSAHLTDPSFSPSAISLFSVGNVPFAPAKKRNRRLKKSDFYISTNEKENEADVESGFPLLTSPISESQLGSLNELFEVVDMADILGEQIEDAEILEAVEDLSFHAGYQPILHTL
uniref:Uncharacterized protein n=1 Tax=Caenorhabditis japonica TaxID=281687 RepID=A0A8R1HYT0_CAEJA